MSTLWQAQACQQGLYELGIRVKLKLCLAHQDGLIHGKAATYVYTQQEMQELQAEELHRQATWGLHHIG